MDSGSLSQIRKKPKVWLDKSHSSTEKDFLVFPVMVGLIGSTIYVCKSKEGLGVYNVRCKTVPSVLYCQYYNGSLQHLYYSIMLLCLSRGHGVPGWWGGEEGVCSEWHREDLLWHRETNRCPHMELWAGTDYKDKMRLESAKCLWFWMIITSPPVAHFVPTEDVNL